jgi:hypothetical protein
VVRQLKKTKLMKAGEENQEEIRTAIDTSVVKRVRVRIGKGRGISLT